MNAPGTTTWTCPDCGERIPVQIKTRSKARGSVVTVSLDYEEAWLADAWAHVFTHTDGGVL